MNSFSSLSQRLTTSSFPLALPDSISSRKAAFSNVSISSKSLNFELSFILNNTFFAKSGSSLLVVATYVTISSIFACKTSSSSSSESLKSISILVVAQMLKISSSCDSSSNLLRASDVSLSSVGLLCTV